MSLNCNEINKILAELSLEGAFVQDVVQPGYDTLALYVYKHAPLTLLICTAHDACRIHATTRKITRNEKPLRFMELLKSRIKGARIDFCAQIGLERVVEFRLSHGGEKLALYARLWSGAANVILCDENNIIIDAMYRRPARSEISGKQFSPPVPDNTKPQREWPVRDFTEIQAEYAAQNPNAAPLTYNEKVDLWYAEHARTLSREALLSQAEKWHATAKSKLEAALEKLINKRASFQSAERYRHQGDLILTYGHLINGSSNFLECDDYETGGKTRIAIDPKKNAQENAAAYYANYRKAQSGTAALEHDIALGKKRLAALDAQYNAIRREQNPVKMEQMLRRSTTPRQQKKKAHPGLDYNVDGWQILVGRDASENDELLRHHVKGNDTWLHTRDFSGGYVFIKNKAGKAIPREILLDAANLAIYHSKARKAGKADLYCAEVKHLRRAKGGPKGLVIPTHERNIYAELDKARLAKLNEISASSLN